MLRNAGIVLWGLVSVWFALAFVGIDGLINPWQLHHGAWFWIAASLEVSAVMLVALYMKSVFWAKFMGLSVSLGWLTVQFFGHWQYFFTKPSGEYLEKYYGTFDTWYLIGPLADRIIPDGYHLILHVLLLFCLMHSLASIIFRWPSRH
jgi:hypothetical protein